jgi:hypothetical protein
LAEVRLRFIGRLAKFANLEGFDYDNKQYGDSTMKANTSFGSTQQQSGGPTTITISSKLNTMDDDDEPFGYGGEQPPF